MSPLISTRPRRLAWAILAFVLAFGAMFLLTWIATADAPRKLTDGEVMKRFLIMPALAAFSTLALLTSCVGGPGATVKDTHANAPAAAEPAKPFMAQVVGVQWLNPLHRKDYPTEWELLWTLGLAQPNKNDDMVRTEPKKFSTLQTIGSIAVGNDGKETFEGYHEKYLDELTVLFHDIYFSGSSYFYNAHSLKDKSTWRELAGIHVEYALPDGRLDPIAATQYTRNRIIKMFHIGNTHLPTTWSRNTPPDVQVTMGGPNAGFTSLSAALRYLQAHPNETVWAMNWDAPNFPPSDEGINENMVLLVLAGPNYKTERDALAWIGYPATHSSTEFETKKGMPPRPVQALQATLNTAVENAGKQTIDIGYMIHDANLTHPDSQERLRNLAHALTLDAPELDMMKHAFNTPALLGEMGAGTALTNVALGIAYANHFGKNVLVAGTTDPEHPTAVLVVPPATVRPIDPDKPWYRARGGNHAYLMWWGIRHDETSRMQGYSD
ncbi:virulence factor [Rugamonas apoptosis]|uniref:Virulence factor n=1 Tax=Rugamonas apoptosis TaxID=2758570 RepID=A0A7W2IKV6_9BURK|nr:virulence factor [Rugamonas apoptosis]MBA5688185.1 virulence factor [Rugamonas apoptosis]